MLLKTYIMKKVVLCLMFICASVLAWGQTAKGKELLKKANAGDASAQSELAECYEFGEEGFAKDEKQALTWYTKAAEQNDMYAFSKLVLAYKEGRLGAPVDDQKYIYYLTKGAEGGRADFMTDLAVYNRDGKYGFKKDENQFLTLICKAIELKHSRSLYELAVYYKNKNKKDEAVRWFKECADYLYYIGGLKTSDVLNQLQQLGVNYDPTTVDIMTFHKTYKYPSTEGINKTGSNAGNKAVTEKDNTNTNSPASPKQEASPKKVDKSQIVNNLKEADKVVKGIKNLIKK